MITIKQLLTKTPQNQNHGASFEDPLSLLDSCHKKIINFSSTLHKLSIKLHQDGWSDELISTAQNISHYFNVAGSEHHLDEEQHLFPAIIALNINKNFVQNEENREVISLINQMIKEHVESDALWEKINKLLETQSKDFKQLESLAEEFESSMHEHAEIENKVIFPYAKEKISKEDFKIIGAAIAKRRGVKINKV